MLAELSCATVGTGGPSVTTAGSLRTATWSARNLVILMKASGIHKIILSANTET